MGIGYGILLFAIIRSGLVDARQAQPFRSLFFKHAERWPGFVKGFVPLDLTMTCLYFGLVITLVLATIDSPSNAPRTARQWLLFAVGTFVGFGAFGGAMGAMLYGWYSSLE